MGDLSPGSGLGIVAGGGGAPRLLLQACAAEGRPVFVVAFRGQTDPETVEGVPHIWARLGEAVPIKAALDETGIRDLVMIGRIRRPALTELRADRLTAGLLARAGLRLLGDDGLLRAVAAEIERHGYRLHASQEILADLLAPGGVIAGQQFMSEEIWDDLKRARSLALALGRLDVGQAAVVQQGLVLGVEAIEGTDALLERCGPLAREGRGGVLVKMAKPQQDSRFDLPTIGLTTVEKAAAAGLAGIGIEARRGLLLERPAVIAAAERLGIFVMGLETGQEEGP